MRAAVQAWETGATLNQPLRRRALGRGMGCEAPGAAMARAMASIGNEAGRPPPGCAARAGLIQRCRSIAFSGAACTMHGHGQPIEHS